MPREGGICQLKILNVVLVEILACCVRGRTMSAGNLNIVLVEIHACCGRGGIMSVRNPECCAC